MQYTVVTQLQLVLTPFGYQYVPVQVVVPVAQPVVYYTPNVFVGAVPGQIRFVRYV